MEHKSKVTCDSGYNPQPPLTDTERDGGERGEENGGEGGKDGERGELEW